MSREPLDRAPRVLFVHSSDELYGSDRMLLEVVKSMPSPGRVQATVLLPGDPGTPGPLSARLEQMGVRVVRCSLPILRRALLKRAGTSIRLAGHALTLARQLWRLQPQVVYVSTSAGALVAVMARALTKAHVVVHVQEVWAGPEARLLGSLIRSAHEVIAISQPVKAALWAPLQSRCVVVENGVDIDSTPLQPIPEMPLRLLMASRWNGWKGHGTLLRAWDEANIPGVLTIVGSAPPQGDGVDVGALVQGLSRPESVRLVGQVDSIYREIDQSHAVVVPSDAPEPFGLVAIEAFGRGRPVIGSDGGGLALLVEDGRTGWKYPLGDVSALARILKSLDLVALTQRGEAARVRYLDSYSTSAFSARMADRWAAMGLTPASAE